jgi:amino acid transporter
MNLGLISFLTICIIGFIVLILERGKERSRKRKVLMISLCASTAGIILVLSTYLLGYAAASFNTLYLLLFFAILIAISLFKYRKISDENLNTGSFNETAHRPD